MGLFNRGAGIPKSATFRVTQEGREKLQQFNGDPKSRILTHLETEGSSNIEEISRGVGISRGKVESMLPSMIKGGYVQFISSAMVSDDE